MVHDDLAFFLLVLFRFSAIVWKYSTEPPHQHFLRLVAMRLTTAKWDFRVRILLLFCCYCYCCSVWFAVMTRYECAPVLLCYIYNMLYAATDVRVISAFVFLPKAFLKWRKITTRKNETLFIFTYVESPVSLLMLSAESKYIFSLFDGCVSFRIHFNINTSNNLFESLNVSVKYVRFYIWFIKVEFI